MKKVNLLGKAIYVWFSFLIRGFLSPTWGLMMYAKVIYQNSTNEVELHQD